jgi:hypothetical protein
VSDLQPVSNVSDLPLNASLAALEQASTVEELLPLHAQVSTFRALWRRHREYREQQHQAAYLKLCTERKMGKLLYAQRDADRFLQDAITGENWAKQLRAAGKEPTQTYLLQIAKRYAPKLTLNTDADSCGGAGVEGDNDVHDQDHDDATGDGFHTRAVILYPTNRERAELTNYHDVAKELGTDDLTSTVLEAFRSIRRAAQEAR